MNWPPSLIRINIRQRQRRINLWLPLFIILPLVAVLMIAFIPLLLVAAVILWRFGLAKPLILSVPMMLSCMCALRGLEVKLQGKMEHVLISVR